MAGQRTRVRDTSRSRRDQRETGSSGDAGSEDFNRQLTKDPKDNMLPQDGTDGRGISPDQAH